MSTVKGRSIRKQPRDTARSDGGSRAAKKSGGASPERQNSIERRGADRQEVRELFETIAANMLDGMAIVDWEGSVLFANRAAYHIVGLRPRRNPAGLTMTQVIHPDDLQRAFDDNILAKEGKGGFLTQYRILTPKGRIKWIETIGQKVTFRGREANLVTFRDISKRRHEEEAAKKSKKQLLLSEKKYADAFHSSPFAISISEPTSGTFIDVNKAYEMLTGFSRKELIGHTVVEVGLWDNPEERERYVRAIESRRKLKDFEARLRRKDGTKRDVVLSASIIEVGGENHLQSIVHDVTEQKAAEKRLHLSEKKFAEAFKTSPLPISISDPRTGILLDINEAYEDLTGFTRHELIGNLAIALGLWADPSERERYISELKAHQRIVGFQAKLRKMSGSIRDVVLSASVINVGGVSHLQTIVHDITDQKRAEEQLLFSEKKFSAAFHSSPDAMAITELKTGRFIDINQAFMNRTGYRREELIGSTIQDIHIWEYPQEHILFTEELFAKRSLSLFDMKLRTRRGDIRDMLMSASIIEIGEKAYVLALARDITSRKRIEEALKESEERYRRITSAITDYIYTVYLEQGNVVRTVHSPACEAVTGYTPEDFERDRNLWYYMVEEEDRELVRDHFNRVTTEERVQPIEHRIRRKDGSVRWVSNMPVIHRDYQGAMISYDGVVSDITERKLAEQELRESEERFRTLHNAVFGGIGIHDKGIILDCNQGLSNISGYSLDELIGMNGLDLIAPVWREFVMRQIVSGYDAPYEVEGIRKDGTIFPLEIRGKNIPYHGREVRVTEFRDITERRQAEKDIRDRQARLDSIFRVAPTGIGVVVDRVLQEVNDRICEMTGYSREELTGQSARILYPTQEDYDFVGSEKYRQIGEQGTGTVETRWMKKDSTIIHIILSSTPIDPDDRSVGVTFTALDITERKRDETALKINAERMVSLLKINQMTDAPIHEITRFALEEAVRLTQSTIGYLAFLNEDETILTMYSWSETAMEECKIVEKPITYVVAETGLWGEAVRQRKAVITNDYNAPNPLVKGYPEGHVAVNRHMNVPVFEGRHIVLVAGVGNKKEPYDDTDVQQLTLLMEGMWRLLDRKRTEEVLRESEERYRLMAELTGKLVYDYDVSSGHMTWHGALSQLNGILPEEFSEIDMKAWNTMIHPEDRADTIMTLESALKECGPYQAEYRICRKDGSCIYVEDHGVFLPDASGNAYRMLGSIGDITDRIRATEALKESEERYHSMFENSHAAMLLIEPATGRIIDANPAACAYYGFSRHELTSRKITEINTLTPDEVFTEMERARTMKKRGFAFRHRLANGDIRDVEVFSGPITVAGKTLLYSIVHDITERRRAEEALRESEERFRSLIQNSSDIIVILDGNGTISYEAPSLSRVLGYPAGHLSGRTPLDFIHPEDVDKVATDLGEVYQGQNDGLPTEFRFLKPDGSWIYLEAIGNNLLDYPGINGVVVTARDITERKKAEDLRLEMERRLLHAQRLESLGVMAGGIAHDFNNLLMAILGNLDLAQLDLSPVSRSRPFIDHALVAARRAADLTNQMLAYSGKGRFDLKIFDLSELVEEMSHLLKASISKTVTLNLQASRDLPHIKADPGQIQQIIMNLIVNASEAIGDAPGVVIITTGSLTCTREYLEGSRLKEKPQPGEYVFFEVEDTGCGIDAETMDRLFDPFFTTKFTGRGLGLAAVSGIITGHRGAIIVNSEPAKGTTIRVLLPVSPEQPRGAARERGKATASIPKQEGKGLPEGKVLVVDDEEMVRDLCRAMVQRLGYTVLTASDGEEAVKVYREHAADIICVILDLTMPRKDGMETLDELKRLDEKVKVILSSGFDEQDITQRFLGKGLSGFIKKPYHLESLRNELEKVLAGA